MEGDGRNKPDRLQAQRSKSEGTIVIIRRPLTAPPTPTSHATPTSPDSRRQFFPRGNIFAYHRHGSEAAIGQAVNAINYHDSLRDIAGLNRDTPSAPYTGFGPISPSSSEYQEIDGLLATIKKSALRKPVILLRASGDSGDKVSILHLTTEQSATNLPRLTQGLGSLPDTTCPKFLSQDSFVGERRRRFKAGKGRITKSLPNLRRKPSVLINTPSAT